MDIIHRKLLQRNYVYLVGNLVLKSEFMSILLSKKILYRDAIEEIENQSTTSAKNRIFLDILSKRGPNAFDIFLEALESSDQLNIKYKLLNQPCTEPSVQSPLNIIPDYYLRPKLSELTYEQYDYLSRDFLFDSELEQNMDYKNVLPLDSYPIRDVNGYIGYAAIINLTLYEPKRIGSEIDCTNLKKLFNKLKIKTNVCCTIQSSEKLEEHIESIAALINDEVENYSFFICILMGHGVNKYICTPDGNKTELQKIYNYFLEGSKKFMERPMIFIIQACQSGYSDSEFQFNNNMNSIIMQESFSSNNDIYSPDAPFYDLMPNFTRELGVEKAFDRYVLQATVPGLNAYLNENSGSIFVKVLVFILFRYYQTDHLNDMVQAVIRIMKCIKDDEGRIVQCPVQFSTLSKKLFLRT